MKRVWAILILAVAAAQGVELKPAEVSLARVRRIFVDQLGGGKESDQMRDMIVAALQNAGIFVITENPERSDASLKGSGDDKIYT